MCVRGYISIYIYHDISLKKYINSKVDGANLTVNAVLIAMASVVGLALVLNLRTWWQVADSVLNSQRKRLHSAANNVHKLKSEGFMKVENPCHLCHLCHLSLCSTLRAIDTKIDPY